MATFSTFHHAKALTFLILFLKTLAADPISSFSFTEFEEDPKFKSNVALFGSAEVVNGGSAVQLAGAGKVMFKKAIKLVEGKPRQLASFSTYFAFSINGDSGLAFVIVPSGSGGDAFENSSSGLSSALENRKFKGIFVEISASGDGRSGRSADYGVAIDVNNSIQPAKSSNASSFSMDPSRGEKIHAWIDYEASSRRLEVRLSQHGHLRPSDPLLWYSIDISNIWKEEEIFVGFSPLKENASQKSFLYSWSFMLRHFPHWMHSEPLDPKALAKNTESLKAKPRSDCFLRVLAAMIFGAGCGALTAFIMLYLWTIFGGNGRPVVPEEYVMKPIDYEYKKVEIVVDKKAIEGCKK